MKKVIINTVLVSVGAFLTASIVTNAGNLAPSEAPSATGFTLTDIYNRLTSNTEAVEGEHDFSSSEDPAASMQTLTQIYEAIPTIVANTVKQGTSYLGIAGTLTPDGGAERQAQEIFFPAKPHI